ncbi:MAG TPA: L,D-transpeptidase [Verrucomicrobiae bacterium]|jgi:hypothetical protein
MNANPALPNFLNRARRLGVPLSQWMLAVDVGSQTASLFEKSSAPLHPGGEYHFVKTFRCSTSRFGIGQREGSNRTPLGLHRIAEKIGDGWPAGTVFKARQPVGYTWKGLPDAKITTRIFWLDGLEPGFNRGGNVDSHARYIYIHGTGDQTTIGKPASCGCVHLADADIIPLFAKLPSGTLVWIQAGAS